MNNDLFSLGRALGFTLRNYTRKLHQEFENHKLNISVDQFVMLNIIHNHTDITLAELSVIMGIDKSAVMRHIDYLEQMKWMGRFDDVNDRRKKILGLTNKGIDHLNKARNIEMEHTHQAMAGLSKNEIEIFKLAMNKIQKNVLDR